MKLLKESGFSLIEVTMALGIAAFAMIAVLGLLPVGLASAYRASEQTTAAQIANDIAEDLLAIGDRGASPRFDIPVPNSTNVLEEEFFLASVVAPPLESGDDEETVTDSSIGYLKQLTKGGSKYGVKVTWRKSGVNQDLNIGSVVVWWPGEASLANSMGKITAAVAVNNF